MDSLELNIFGLDSIETDGSICILRSKSVRKKFVTTYAGSVSPTVGLLRINRLLQLPPMNSIVTA